MQNQDIYKILTKINHLCFPIVCLPSFPFGPFAKNLHKIDKGRHGVLNNPWYIRKGETMKDLLKKALAECLGTFVLVFFACGVAALTNGDIVPTALAFGLAIVAMAYSVGRISGCHINPAVSLGLFLAKRISGKELLVYILSQLVGGILGGVLLFGIVKMSGLAAGDACNYAINSGVAHDTLNAGNIIGSLLTEIFLTFIFVYVILNVTDEKANFGAFPGLIIGLTLTLVHLIGIPLTGTSVNPARSIATAFAALIYQGSATALSQVWISILAPLVGAVLAAVIYKALHKNKEERVGE